MNSFYAFELQQYVPCYQHLLNSMAGCTVYHESVFLLAEEQAEDGSMFIFCGEYGHERVMLPAVRRNIGRLSGLENFAELYDIKTPHEYSGAVASREEPELYRAFYRDLATYCIKKSIIFGFFRFNPYRQDSMEARAVGFSVRQSDEQVCIDVSQGVQETFRRFRPSVRRNVRRAQHSALVYEVVPDTRENMQVFMALYRKAMDFLQAEPFFYFSPGYFEGLRSAACAKLLFVRKGDAVVAASILLDDEPNSRIYYHLGCFDRDYSLCRPMDFLYYAICQLAESWGRRTVHLGGGAETLHRFKAGFSPERVSYYIGSKIFDEERYAEVCDSYLRLHPEMRDSQYMPLYRSISAPPQWTRAAYKWAQHSLPSMERGQAA